MRAPHAAALARMVSEGAVSTDMMRTAAAWMRVELDEVTATLTLTVTVVSQCYSATVLHFHTLTTRAEPLRI